MTRTNITKSQILGQYGEIHHTSIIGYETPTTQQGVAVSDINIRFELVPTD